MTGSDRHKLPPVSYRPPGELRAWLLERAAATGQPVGQVLNQALSLYRELTDLENGQGSP